MAFFLTTLALALSPHIASAGEGFSRADVALNAQLWKRPTGASNRLKFTPLSEKRLLEAELESTRGRDIVRRRIESEAITVDVTFLLVVPAPPERAFVVTQAQIFHADFGFIAECANYDSIEGELAIGVGVCSGSVDGIQYGISFSRP
jgi:hypothetical protein